MNIYISSLIAVMVVCHITVSLAPDSEYAARCIRYVCALVILLTILTPIRELINISETLPEKISSFLSGELVPAYEETEAGAAGLMQYITEQYQVDELSVVLLTDETDCAITELRISIPDCPYTKCAVIEADLNEQLNFPVYVSGK